MEPNMSQSFAPLARHECGQQHPGTANSRSEREGGVTQAGLQILLLTYFLLWPVASAIRTLIKDCPGTPSRSVAKSNREIIQHGKSTPPRFSKVTNF
jgi:hypothetical protein